MHFLLAVLAVSAVELDSAALEHKAEEHKTEDHKIEEHAIEAHTIEAKKTEAAFPHFDFGETDPASSQADVLDELHDNVQGVHEQVGDLLAAHDPTAVLHPESPLDHHERLAEVLRGLGITQPALMAHARHEPDPAASDTAASDPDGAEGSEEASEEASDPAASDPAASDPAASDSAASDPDGAEGSEEASDPAASDPADAEGSEEAPPAEHKDKAKRNKVAGLEKKALAQMGNSLKMMVMLHVMMQPLEKKLEAAMHKMPASAQERTKDVLAHVKKIDALSLSAMSLVTDVKAAAHGTKKQKAVAIMKLMVGLAEVEKGVKSNLAAMKEETAGLKASSPHGANPMTQKLHALLATMETKVHQELADPARKDDPLVAVDVSMLSAMKTAVKKSEALVLVAQVAMKKAKTDEERTKIKFAIKGAMHKVMDHLKQQMGELKEQGAVLSMMKTVHSKKHHAEEESADDQDAVAVAGEQEAAAEQEDEDAVAVAGEHAAAKPQDSGAAPEFDHEHKAAAEQEAPAKEGFMEKLEEDLKKWHTDSKAPVKDPLKKFDAAIGPDGKLSKLRSTFAAKMAAFEKDHEKASEATAPFLPSFDSNLRSAQ